MKYLLVFLIIFIILFIINYIFTYVINKNNEDIAKIKSYRYIINRYKIKITKEKSNLLIKYIILINSIIMSIPITLVVLLDINYILVLIISFIMFIVLMLLSYNLLGRYLKKKGW